MSRVSLIGLPGSGKSTIGRQLAQRLQLPFIDCDQALEQRLGCTIREYFERMGEEAFRDHEQTVISELSQAPTACVLATGGGAVLRVANRAALRAHTQVVYLCVTPEEAFRRVRRDARRPLLQVADPMARMQALFAERDPLYRACAHCVVQTGRPSAKLLLAQIVSALQALPASASANAPTNLSTSLPTKAPQPLSLPS